MLLKGHGIVCRVTLISWSNQVLGNVHTLDNSNAHTYEDNCVCLQLILETANSLEWPGQVISKAAN